MSGSRLLGRHSTGLNHIWLEDARGLTYVTVFLLKLISNLESLKGQFYVLCFLPSVPLHSATWSLDTLSLTTSMLMTASCMFPLRLGSHLSGTTCLYLSLEPCQLLPSTKKIWRHMSLTWCFSLRHRYTQQPVDAKELFHHFCFRTPIRLSRHWAWLLHGYWC